ncbi:hypothetical protein BST95_09670 [Halioglobus japonicus]|uniref:Uncharacterized protein n=1 Tax=Halioglobus japonicus TaxID=930805 RepID=A0AAP8SNC3_9GAMM|nr:hypothetical protein [Halioglobus japonicus]AQA18462.1 hypothetical protein BST95_09670 [Halioglobus japonicus]PLW86477.1 hypothetical protein C0029_08705 [Halioglobus japonicus]GHD12615.1 hypothetical protein GCM10007052_13830 [Halioglobus japonicus]
MVIVVAAALLWVAQPAPLYRDPPRQLPWKLPDYRDSKRYWHIDANGLIQARVEHFFLADISPSMVAWFYRVLPVSTVDLGGERMPLYHIFHPTEHGRIRVVEAADDGSAGMGKGALIQREEWFGPYDSRGQARLEELSAERMVAIPEFAGLPMGRIEHRFEQRDGGTYYTVSSTIGSQLPVLGGLLNYYIRNVMFHPAVMEQWQRHQVEEVASLNYFLPEVYSQRGEVTHFTLADNRVSTKIE